MMGAVGWAVMDSVQSKSEVGFADMAGPGQALVVEERRWT